MMRRRRKNPRLCLLLNSGLWRRCSLHKCGRPRCSCPFLYKYWYSPVSSSSTYCPQSRDSSSYVKSVMSLHCSRMPRPTQFSSLTICTTGSPCFTSVSMPTSTANPSFISSATSAISVPSSVVASTKFSTSFTVSASICSPSASTLALYVGSFRSKHASSQLNSACVLQSFNSMITHLYTLNYTPLVVFPTHIPENLGQVIPGHLLDFEAVEYVLAGQFCLQPIDAGTPGHTPC